MSVNTRLFSRTWDGCMETLRLANCKHGASLFAKLARFAVTWWGFSQLGRGSASDSGAGGVGFVQRDATALDARRYRASKQPDRRRGRFKTESDRET